jgi:hypothetical protein
VLIDVAEVVDE